MLHKALLRRSPKRTACTIAVALLPILACMFLPRLDNLGNYNGDETLWLAVSNKLFRLYAVERDFGDPAWQQDYSTFGTWQPQIGKYVIGLGTYFGGYTAEPYQAFYYNWQHDLAWNMANKGVPPAELVLTGRLPVACMGMLAGLLFYWLASLLLGPWPGLLAVAILLAGRLLVDSSRVAMIDSPALAFGLATLIALVYLLRALRRHEARKALLLAIPTGVVAGLAIGTKLNTLLVVAVCVVMLLGEALVQLRVRPRLGLVALLACATSILCAWLVFYASNPFLYGNAIAGSRHLVGMGALVATIPFDQITSQSGRVQAIWDQLLVYAPLARLGLPYDRWLILFGLASLATAALPYHAYLRRHQLDVLLVWTVVSYVGITLWLPHPWPRYYLPLQPCNALLETIAIVWPLRGLWMLSVMLRQRSGLRLQQRQHIRGPLRDRGPMMQQRIEE